MVRLPFCSSNMANDIGTKRERCFINNRKLSYLITFPVIYILACIRTSLYMDQLVVIN